MKWFDKYVGAPFLDGGRSIDGVDCWGLVRLIYERELQIDLPSYADVSARNLIEVARNIARGKDGEEWIDVIPSAVAEFDVCVLKHYGKNRVGHVGVMLNSKTLLHIEESCNAVAVPISHYTIKERVACYRRHKIQCKR